MGPLLHFGAGGDAIAVGGGLCHVGSGDELYDIRQTTVVPVGRGLAEAPQDNPAETVRRAGAEVWENMPGSPGLRVVKADEENRAIPRDEEGVLTGRAGFATQGECSGRTVDLGGEEDGVVGGVSGFLAKFGIGEKQLLFGVDDVPLDEREHVAAGEGFGFRPELVELVTHRNRDWGSGVQVRPEERIERVHFLHDLGEDDVLGRTRRSGVSGRCGKIRALAFASIQTLPPGIEAKFAEELLTALTFL